jgi:hypothetical protein
MRGLQERILALNSTALYLLFYYTWAFFCIINAQSINLCLFMHFVNYPRTSAWTATLFSLAVILQVSHEASVQMTTTMAQIARP